MSKEVPYLGSKISLVSKAEIRYEGTLYTIDPNEATVALAKVRSFGTENRPTDRPLPARNEVFDFIIFRGQDIKDLHVCEPPKHCPDSGIPPDPAIVKSSQPPPGHNVPIHSGQQFQGGMGQSYQPFTQPLFYQGQPAPGFPPHQGQAGNTQEEGLPAVEQTPEQLSHPSVSAIGTRPISGSQSSTPPLSRKSPTSDQGVQLQSQTPEKSSNESQQKQASHSHNYSHHHHHHQQQQHPHHHHHQQQHHHHHHQQQQHPHQQQQQQHVHHHHQQQHQRDHPRGHGVRHDSGRGGAGGHRVDHRDRGDNRNDGRNNEQRGDKNMTSSFVRGRGSNRGQQMREGGGSMRGGPQSHPRRGRGGGRSSEPLKFDTDFDFETSNAQFDKEDIEKELKNLTITDKPVNGEKTEDDPEIEEEEGGGEEEEEDSGEVYYDKKKSFFDNISCDATEKARGQRVTWREERKLNSETFGISENYRRNYRGRGNWRGNNRGGWRGRGRGGGYNGRDGGFGGNGGYNNNRDGYYGNRNNSRGRRPEWDYADRRRMEGPQRVEVQS